MPNKLFTFALAAAMTFGVSGVALAQDNAAPAQEQGGRGPMRMDPNRQLEHMTKELGLSADQQAQIKPVLVDRQQKMEALFQNQSLSREDRRAQMMAIRQDSNAKIQVPPVQGLTLANAERMIRQSGLTVGKTTREAFVLMKALVEAADIQLKMEATGGELVEIPAAICEKTAHQYEHHDSGRGSADWPAYLRMLDTVDTGWRN